MSLDNVAPQRGSRRGPRGYTGTSGVSSAKPKKAGEARFAGLDDQRTLESENTGPLGLLESARTLMIAAVELQAHYRINQRDSVLKCYRAALMLTADDKALDRFRFLMQTKLEMQEKEVTRDKVLNLTFLYAFGKTDEDARKSASLFTRALRPSFKAKSPTSGVLSLLQKHGGFKGLAQVNGRGKTDQAESKPDVASATEQPKQRPSRLAAATTLKSPAVSAKGPRQRPMSLKIAATLVDAGRNLMQLPVGSEFHLRGRLEASDPEGFKMTIHQAERE